MKGRIHYGTDDWRAVHRKNPQVANVSTENRLHILRLIENLALGTAAVGYRTKSMHGAGSPQAQRIMISRQSNMAMKKELAKAIAHIEE